jgi:hypothetical protein
LETDESTPCALLAEVGEDVEVEEDGVAWLNEGGDDDTGMEKSEDVEWDLEEDDDDDTWWR